MSGESCVNGHSEGTSCSCESATPSVSQTLEELDFTRGIWTAALDGNETELLSCLKKKNIHPDTSDSSGYTALHYAARNGHFNICRILLDYSASPNIQTNSGKVTALHRAAYCGHVNIVKLLIKHGGDVSSADADGKLPLHKAAEKGHKDVIDILVKEYSSGKRIPDNRGRKPADCAPSSCVEVQELLRDHGNQSEINLDTG